MTSTFSTRLLALDDVPAVAALELANRAFFTPWMPRRADEWFTEGKQREVAEGLLDAYERGQCLPHVILDGDRVIGRITLNGIVRGAFQSCSMGYWVAEDANGRGAASAAVTAMLAAAFGELNLHRVQAEILPHNAGSRKVLERNGFTRFAVAPAYLYIDGRWQDHEMFHVLNPDWVER